MAWRVVAVLVMAVTGVRGAHAETAHEGIEWVAPVGCPSRIEFVSKVAYHAGGEDGGRAVVSATQLDDGSWEARIDMGASRRRLHGATCDEVAEAAALVIGTALRQRANESAKSGSAAEETDRRPAPSGEKPALTRRRPASPPNIDRVTRVTGCRTASIWAGCRIQWLARGQVGADAGTFPAVAIPVTGEVGFRTDRMEVELALSYAGSSAVPSGQVPDLSMTTRLFYASTRGCGRVGMLWLCGAVEAGAMQVQAATDRESVSASGAWLAASAGPAVVWRLARSVALRASLEAVAPVIRPRFRLNGGLLHLPARLAGRAAVGVEFAFR